MEGVMTYKPYIFGRGGVDIDPIKAGAIWTVWSTDVDRYDIKPIKYKEHFIDLTASDNVAIDFDVYVTMQINKGESPKIHENSGSDWYNRKIKDTFALIFETKPAQGHQSNLELARNQLLRFKR